MPFLSNVETAGDFVTLTQDNFETLTDEVFKLAPTYQKGSPRL